MDSNTIKQVFEAILEDESILDDINFQLIEDAHQHIGFYILDRDIDLDELDFS